MNKRRAAAIAILVLGILLIAAGLFRGELDVILKKAAVVCMECIGLG
ncbi:MAG: thioredoxin [Saccharofermentans sp.]|nr:thioredoxin [Saccharofermentans sp.]